MKLASILSNGRPATAVVVDGEVIELTAADAGIPADMPSLLAGGDAVREKIDAVIRSNAPRVPLADVKLLPPVPHPTKFLGIGLNFAAHAAEGGVEVPEIPPVFPFLANSVNGPYDDVQLPKLSGTLDYEGELGVVIGRRCRHVRSADAADVIAGYVVVNDYSVREIQWRTPQWSLGKSFDTHSPFGPWIATPDEFGGDLSALTLRTWINGDLRQQESMGELVHDPSHLVEHLSEVCTLEPGDVIATGTPGGVAAGFDPPRWLKVGDVVRVEIDGIGAIENNIVAE